MIKKGTIAATRLITKVDNAWSKPVEVLQNSKGEMGYFHWFSNSELYFYQEVNGGDIFKGTLENNQLKVENIFTNLNTSATEFSPYVDSQNRFVIFTRYKEGDESQQGFFISYNEEGNWSEPQKIENLPYGWNAYITQNGKRFLFTDGDDIYSVPIEDLGLKR